ncbi:MAG: tetraacyldisaccharide 4'-kinase [Planctomycetales bacterium]|nr:tetraacyldisaccharide 4'-kinase [Planctomycetales bacterium]
MISPQLYQEILDGRRFNPLAVVARCGLRLASIPYGLVVDQRNRQFDNGRREVHRVDVPVISVGNLTVGGTGKTPFVAWLARWFRNEAVRVSLISRGYGAADGQRNDEAKELEARLPDVPHLQNADRVAAARIAIEELETQLIILDDAFQHRRIHRDLDIVLLDATQPFGFGYLLPRGLLREPAHQLKRAQVVAITRCDLVDEAALAKLRAKVKQLAPQATCVEVAQQPTQLLSASGSTAAVEVLSGKPTLACCGIGNPRAFFTTLEQQGVSLVDTRALPDHCPFDRAIMQQLTTWVSEHPSAQLAVCTHKDLVKIASDRLGRLPLYALQMDLCITAGLAELETRLRELLVRIPPE